MHRSNQHRLLRALADYCLDIPDFDCGQQSGFLVQIVSHDRKAGCDNPANIVSRAVHNIECHRSPKIHHHGRRAMSCLDGNSIRETIWPDRLWFWIFNTNATNGFMIQKEHIQLKRPPQGACRGGAGPGHDAADDNLIHPGRSHEPLHQARRLPLFPSRCRYVPLACQAIGAGQAEVRVGVSYIQ